MFEILKGKKKTVERICGNCRIFNVKDKRCGVVILHEGEKVNIPVDAEDSCFFEEEYFDPITGKNENFNEIKEVKMWTEDKDGKKSDQGIVKVEMPEELEINRPQF